MVQKWPQMVQKWSKMIKNWFKNDTKMVQIRPTLIQKWSKNGHKWSKDCPNMVQKRSHISICDGFISSLSAAHHQFIISSWSVHHQFVISSSSVHHQVIVSSSSVHHPFIVKLGPKNITQIGLRAEGAKANGQRLIHKSINLTISKFNWSHQLCSQLCSLCSNYSMWSIITNYVPKVNGDIPPSLMVLLIMRFFIVFIVQHLQHTWFHPRMLATASLPKLISLPITSCQQTQSFDKYIFSAKVETSCRW